MKYLVLTVAVGGLMLGGQQYARAQAQDAAPGAFSAQVEAMSYQDLERLVPEKIVFKDPDNWGFKDTVTIAGVEYTLPFMLWEDVTLSWDQLEGHLPEQLAAAPDVTPTDEQVVAYTNRLTAVSENNFQFLANKAFEENMDTFMARYPNMPEETVRDFVTDGYYNNENGEMAPEAQDAYLQFMALTQVREALGVYMELKEKQ